jgi:uncharacterized protein GlcG (DUF336 family)/mannose-6-phosphate isomerase-like protein (cupin superfamily)
MIRAAIHFLIVASAVFLAGVNALAGTSPQFGVDSAEAVVDAVCQQAKALKAPGAAIAVVDSGGHLLAFARLDGTFPASARIAVGKAHTAAMFRKPTSAFEEIVNKGRTSMVALEDFTPLKGGVPLVIDNVVVGAVGVSGAASADQDEELAVFGAAALGNRSSEEMKAGAGLSGMPVFFPGQTVNAAWQKGAPLIETAQYKVHASRRDQPGRPEVHDTETDVVYVVSGTATLVTGGIVVEPEAVAPGETRGTSIENGDAHELAAGDVIVIPAGTPHWFREVKGPFLYFVVKPVACQN